MPDRHQPGPLRLRPAALALLRLRRRQRPLRLRLDALACPPITRKTDKGLPQYHDADESDVFILSGAEDLVPVLEPDGSAVRGRSPTAHDGLHRSTATARASKGCSPASSAGRDDAIGDVHWRSISKDNILTLYGKDAETRASPIPPIPTRIFSWLICETRDDKGNAILYDYKPEDGAGVDLTQAHERNRGDRDDPRRTANRYLKRIRYGNRVPLLDDAGQRPRFLTDAQIDDAGWMFEVVFDYGEHDADAPEAGRRRRSGPAATTRSRPTAPASRCAPTASASGC